jgi:redox-sensitive bicupin YhaK (pirin superfamily)
MLIEPRTVKLTTRTGVAVRRTLPHAKLKMIGAWCFVDHFGPTEQTDGMVVAAHPHTGLQTVTWLIEGAIEHRDSIGSVQRIEPGQLNLMTAGYGISHSEVSQRGPQRLHAVQLWVALPQEHINTAPAFEHQSNLPSFEDQSFSATVLAGEFLGHRAETKIFSPMMGAELRIKPNSKIELPLDPSFEYGFMLAQGDALVNRQALMTSGLVYSAAGSEQVLIETADKEVIILMLGGEPFGEKMLMWWNFIARTNDEIVEQRANWNNRLQDPKRFGIFKDSIGDWIPAPDLPTVKLQAR